MNPTKAVGYSSKKHPVLEHIFKKYYKTNSQKSIPFYLSDIAEGYAAHGIKEPVSISNTILDLCRQNRGIDSRLPKSILRLGYDLRKKTGRDTNGEKFAGEFVFVGVGNEIKSWLIWPESPDEMIIDSSTIPSLVLKFIRTDEGALFSIIDYADVFSKALHDGKIKVFRIQNPMKWQPNEIDGFYVAEIDGKIVLYPVEAKSRVTGDEINLDQMGGAFQTIKKKLSEEARGVYSIQQLAIKMIKNGVDIAVFPVNHPPIKPERFIRVKFIPEINNWT